MDSWKELGVWHSTDILPPPPERICQQSKQLEKGQTSLELPVSNFLLYIHTTTIKSLHAYHLHKLNTLPQRSLCSLYTKLGKDKSKYNTLVTEVQSTHFLMRKHTKTDFCKENSYPFDFVLDRGLYS